MPKFLATEIMFKKILVPLDGSPIAEAVLPYAQSLAHMGNAEVFLIEVVETIESYRYPFGITLLEPIVHEVRAAANSYVQHVAATLSEHDIHTHAEVVDSNQVAAAILDYASAKEIDLILMATHGRSGFDRLTLGSVADKLVHRAKIPVMLVRPDLT